MNNNKDNNDQDNDKNNRKGINKHLPKKKKNTWLIFENVTASTLNQSRFKNPARSMNAFPFLSKSLYIIIIIIYFIICIHWLLVWSKLIFVTFFKFIYFFDFFLFVILRVCHHFQNLSLLTCINFRF